MLRLFASGIFGMVTPTMCSVLPGDTGLSILRVMDFPSLMFPDWNWTIFLWSCMGAAAPEVLRLYKTRLTSPGIGNWFSYLVRSFVFFVFSAVITTGALTPGNALAAIYDAISIPVMISAFLGEERDRSKREVREVDEAGQRTSDDFERLVERVRSGDHQAETELYVRTLPLVRRVVSRWIRDENVEDIVQEVYARLYPSLFRYTSGPNTTFTAWFSVVARNIAIDFIRKERRVLAREVPFADSEERQRILENIVDQRLDNPPERVELLREAIRSLSSQQRKMAVLHYFMGYSYREIAEMEGIAENTVLTHLHRARSKIREELENTTN